MFQLDIIQELFSDPRVLQYIIGGIIFIIVVIVCYAIHRKLTS
ncbi:MAG: hypothetical protein ACFE9Q_12770 [Candidatus Hodarchaeota archaeon]